MVMLERIVIVFTTLTMMKVTVIEMVTNNVMGYYDNNGDNYLPARKSKNDVTKTGGWQ